MTTWQFVIPAAGPETGNVAELTEARTRKVSWHLDAPSSATFSMDGRDPLAVEVDELATDLIVYADGVPLFRGRIGPSDDTIDTTSHEVSFAAIDYRGLLHRRILWTGSTLIYSQVDQADIAWDLIDDAQNRTAAFLGISRGDAPPTGILRDRTFNAGANVGETLTNLGRVEAGFEWEIDGLLRFNLFHPSRGAAGITPMVWGDNVSTVRRSFDTDAFANAVRVSGETDVVLRESEGLSSGAFTSEGRWEKQISDTDLKELATVEERADFELAQGETPRASYQLGLTPGWWNPGLIWLGDQNRLVIRSGRLNVDTFARVIQIDVSIKDESNQEDVTLHLGPPVLNLSELITDQRNKLVNVARR